MRMVYDPNLDREVPVYTCRLCADRGKVCVPGIGIPWEPEHGCWFDTERSFSIWCPDCHTTEFNANSYRRETLAYIADLRKSVAGDASQSPAWYRSEIERTKRKLLTAEIMDDESTVREREAKKRELLSQQQRQVTR